MGVFLLPSCLMTQREGFELTKRTMRLEQEVAKLESLKHDLEVLLSTKVSDLFDRISRIENIIASIQESVFEGAKEQTQVMAELQTLRNLLDEAKNKYNILEKGHESLAKAQEKIREEKNKVTIPPLKSDHFLLAKKLYQAKRLDDALYLFEEFIKLYETDKDLADKSFFIMGDICKEKSDKEVDENIQLLFKKKAVVYWQKTIENSFNKSNKEEALYKMGLLLESMGNKALAKAAFQGLLESNKKSAHANDAKKHIANLEENESEQ